MYILKILHRESTPEVDFRLYLGEKMEMTISKILIKYLKYEYLIINYVVILFDDLMGY